MTTRNPIFDNQLKAFWERKYPQRGLNIASWYPWVQIVCHIETISPTKTKSCLMISSGPNHSANEKHCGHEKFSLLGASNLSRRGSKASWVLQFPVEAPPCKSTSLYITSLHSSSLYSISLYITSLYSTSLHSTSLYSISLYSPWSQVLEVRLGFNKACKA